MNKIALGMFSALVIGLSFGCGSDTTADKPKADTSTSIEDDVAQEDPTVLLDEESRFEQAVRSAFENQNVAQLEQLTCWDRVPEARREATMKTYARDLAFGAKEVTLTPADPMTPDIAWKLDGISYRSNLKVTKNIKIEFGEGAKYKDGTYFVGEKDGKLFLLAPAPAEE